MEIWDGYGRDGALAHVDLVRGEPIPKGLYHLVCEVLVRHMDGGFLLMKRDLSKPYGGYYEATAGGSALKGEDHITCVKRELFEETGISSGFFEMVGKYISDNTIYYNYLCVTDCDKSSIMLQEGETISYKWVNETEFISFVNSGDMIKHQRLHFYNYFHKKGYITTGYQLLLFDLDGTLLKSDKSISKHTLSLLHKCKKNGFMTGVSTARSELNAGILLSDLMPDILISSGGALVKRNDEYIYKAGFSAEETNQMIKTVRDICGADCEITIDTLESHYWNYKIDPKKQDDSWGGSIYTDFEDFHQEALKMCVEIFDSDMAEKLKNILIDCDCIRFSDGYWYKFTKKGVTKERAILEACASCNIKPENIIAFGDDFSDIGMLKLCGMGIAMGNAIPEVKNMADMVIGTNDEEGIADFILQTFDLS